MKHPLSWMVFVVLALPAIAAGQTRSTTPSDTTTYHLKEITVTGMRLTGSVFETPLSVSVLTAEELRRTRGYGLEEILASVPGVLAQSRYGTQDARITIRGFGARGAGERSNAGTTRGIRIMMDGFPETEPDGRTSLDLVDFSSASHVDILRSNASAIWGNAAGGVINIVSNSGFARPYSSVQSTFGSFGYRRERVSGGSMLGNGRLFYSLSNTNFDGWREHSGSTQATANAGILAPLGERTSLGVYLLATSNLFHIPGPLTQAQYDTDPQQAQGDTASYNPSYLKRDERRFNRLGRVGIALEHGFNDASSIDVTAYVNPKYLQRSERNTFRDFTRYHVGGSAMYTLRQPIGASLRSVLNAGMDEAYQDGAILFYNLVNGERGKTLSTDKREGANIFGAFVQEELAINERLLVSAGVRFDRLTYWAEDFLNPAARESKAYDSWTPKAGITWLFSPQHSVYASLGGGVEVPAGNETDPPAVAGMDTLHAINPLLDPMRSTSIEVGTRQLLSCGAGSLLQALSYDLALYRIEVRDDIIPYNGGRFYMTAGRTERLGVELGVTTRFAHGISLMATMSWSSNTYKDYVIDSTYYKKPGATLDLGGNTMAGMPEMTWYLRLRYEPEFLSHLWVEASMRGMDSYFADDRNTLTVPSWSVVNVSLGVDDLPLYRDILMLTAFVGVNNLTDATYVESAFLNPDRGKWNGQPIFLEPGLPQNFVGSVGLKMAW